MTASPTQRRHASLTRTFGRKFLIARTAAEILIDTLLDWKVEVIFGLPGDGINGLMEALRTRSDKIRFVQVRHEESAAFMACGYAKFTGRFGVCLATSGPGGIHLLNGLYDAKLDGQPVLAITGMPYHDISVVMEMPGAMSERLDTATTMTDDQDIYLFAGHVTEMG